MTIIDWCIVGFVFIILGMVAAYTSRFTRSVADFLSANRCAGRYLIGGAEFLSSFSPAMVVAYFEAYYKGGFPISWWQWLLAAAGLIKALSGWVRYRFRETRELTMAQFFEMRYSRKFRIFTGLLAFASGIVNYAIHPALAARVIVYLCGLPLGVHIFGIEVSTTFIIMLSLVAIAVTITVAGGQIAVMMTDYLQAQLAVMVSLVVVLYLMTQFGWINIVEALKKAPDGQSMLNPFNQGAVQDFNFWFFAILIFLSFYQEMAFQGTQGFFSVAKSPHEAKMARIFGTWQGLPTTLLFIIPALVAYVVFNSPSYSADLAAIQGTIGQIADKQMQKQMTVPIVLTHFLPIGVTGVLVATFLTSAVSNGQTYMHSWGSIFVQDILMPLRKKRLEPMQHLKWLRVAIIAVGILSLIGAALIPIRDFVIMYFQITFAIYAGGAGTAIIGGLYWKHGTTAGAWSAVITGSVLCTSGFILQAVWANFDFLLKIAPQSPNGIQFTFAASLISIVAYIIVSLLTAKQPFNMDKLLHRGQYAMEEERVVGNEKITILRKLTGMDREFSSFDKIIASLSIIWTLFWIVVVCAGSVLSPLIRISDDVWAKWWYFFVLIHLVIGGIAFMLYLVGGVRDIKDLFQKLKILKRDHSDDGSVRESSAADNITDKALARHDSG